MPRTRRFIRSKRVYEIILRAKEGLPFVPSLTMNALIESALARALRGNKLTICHYKWMGNHVHLIVIAEDAELFVFFYQELQKKLTESIKRLLSLDKLNIWEGDAVVAEILDEEKMVQRIAYLYANAARAGLVDSIEEYPGLSTWKEFCMSTSSIEATYSRKVPWIRLTSIKPLFKRSLSVQVDTHTKASLLNTVTQYETLTIKPHAWMKVFNITEPTAIAAFNTRAINVTRAYEQEALLKRKQEQVPTIGNLALRQQPILKPHTPKKRVKRIYVLSSIHELRINYIQAMRDFCALCAHCYQQWKNGNTSVLWPPGAFRPGLRPCSNAWGV